MCGIVAVFAYGGNASPIDRRALQKISSALARRGPDGAGDWASDDGRVALAHRRLAIIDTSSAGAQPMALDGAGGKDELVISFNGEIYNYQELRASLAARGHVFRSTSDTEVLLHLYREYGSQMIDKLRGMFAFALWDGARRQLVLARDPFGIKPLYFADDGRTVWAASQVKALLQAPNVTGAMDPAGHVGFLVWGYVPDPLTMFRQIRAVPAGSLLVIRQDARSKEQRYFDVSAILSEAEGMREGLNLEGAGELDKVELLRAEFEQSVRGHLVSDVPVGIFLSSGIDSATVAAFAAEMSTTPLSSITLGFRSFENTPMDEVPLAEASAGALGLTQHTRWISREEFQDDIPDFLEAMDQPTVDGLNTYFVSKTAHEIGLKVALSGLGGDELFGGYPSFREVPRLVSNLAPARIFGEGFAYRMGAGFRIVSAPVIRRYASPKYASLLEYGTSYGGAYLLRRGLFLPWELPDIVDPDMARQGWSELQAMDLVEQVLRGIRGGRTKVMACEFSLYMQSQLLRQTDWAGMRHSLEIRTPLVDGSLFRALAPFVTSSDPLTKPHFNLLARDRLPAPLSNRPKTGFSVPLGAWLEGENRKGGADLRRWAKHVYAHAIAGKMPEPRAESNILN